MAEASSGQPFEFDISLDPYIVHKDDEEENIENKIVYEFVKDIHLISNCFERFKFAKVLNISSDLKITLSVSSLQEFNEIQKAIKNGDLSKSITAAAAGFGLEIEVGIFSNQTSQVRLLVSLCDESRTERQAKCHFKTQRSETVGSQEVTRTQGNYTTSQKAPTSDETITAKDQSTNLDSVIDRPLQFQIILHIPFQKQSIYSDPLIELRTENDKQFSETKLYHFFENLWISPMISVPANTDYLKYRCQFVIVDNILFIPVTRTMKDKYWKKLKIKPFSRDCFITNEKFSIEAGLCNHIKHLLNTVDSVALKDVIMDIDDLMSLIEYYIRYRPELNIKFVLQCIESFIHEKQLDKWEIFIISGYVFGSVVNGQRSRKNEDLQIISKETAERVLKSLKTLSHSCLPVGSLKKFENIVTDLCLIAFPEQNKNVPLLEFCYPTLSSKFIMNNFDHWQSMPFTCNVETCEHFCNKILVQAEAGDKDATLLLEKFLHHTPIHCTVRILQTDVLQKFLDKKTQMDIVKSRIFNESKKCAKENNFSALLELVNTLDSVHQDILSAVSEKLTNTVIGMVKALSKNDFSEYPQIEKLMNSCILFQSQKTCEELYGVIVVSENKFIHSLFLKLLNAEEMTNVNNSLLTKWVMTWFATAIKHHCSEKTYKRPCDDLQLVYKHLSNLINTTSVSMEEKLIYELKEKSFHFLNDIPLINLIHHVCNTDFLENSELSDLLNEHLLRRLSLSSGKDSILLTMGTSSNHKAFAATRGFSKLLMGVMDVSGLTDTKTDIDSLMLMLKNMDFWIKLMNVDGTNSKQVKKHNVFVKAQSSLTSISKRLVTKNLKCVEVQNLKAFEKEKNLSFVDLLKTCSEDPEPNIYEFWKLAKQKLEKFGKDLDICFGIVQKMKRGTQKNLLPDIPCLDKAETYLEQKIKSFLNGSVYLYELDDGSFVSPLIHSLFTLHMSEMLDSEVFLTLSRHIVETVINNPIEDFESECIEESISQMFGEEDHELIKLPAIVLSILKMLEDEGIDKYKAAWNPLFMEEAEDISEIKIIVEVSDLESEIRCAEKIVKKTFPDWIFDSLLMFREYTRYEEKVHTVKKSLEIVGIKDELDDGFSQAVKSFYALKNSNPEGITLKQLHAAKCQLSLIDEIIDDDFLGILKQLSKASFLVEFLFETAEDDLRQLIDSVEEHSEQFIQESTISALIDVKRFLNSILKKKMQFNKIEVFLKTLEKAASANDKTTLAGKINDCSINIHGLKSLYKSVSNRGELTKDIVTKAVKSGSKFIISLKENGCCEFSLQCKSHGQKEVYSQSDLDDLRSRALLLVNTETKRKQGGKHKAKLQADLKLFIDALDSVICIAGCFVKLAQAGHPDYVSKSKSIHMTIEDLKDKIKCLEQHFEEWMEILNENRAHYFWLNWFFPEQLLKIRDYLENGTTDAYIATLFEYGGFNVEFLSQGRDIFNEITENENSHSFSLPLVGQTLDIALKNTLFQPKHFPKEKNDSKTTHMIQKGQLFVAAIDENSKLVIPTILAIYKNTTGFLPMPHQILFCNSDTKWECIFLLLQRCIRSDGPGFGKQLYCIVGVEKLSNEVQFKLVDELDEMLQKPFPYLAIICQGGTHHPFIDHFDTYVHHIQPMTNNAIEKCFRTLWPMVVTITSDVSGQGKTELVYDMAAEHDKGIRTIHISGDINIKSLKERMSQLNLLPHHVLHIDIGTVSKPNELDLLLFQLIILGFLVDGPSLFQLPTQHISIEVANSINNVLRNSLQTVMFFNRKHLTWENYKNFKVEQEICSPVQVVCCYLNAREEGKLDSEDLYFSGKNTVNCLSAQKCQSLLQKYFATSGNMSFSIVNIFLYVLADQLKKLSCSLFFRSSNLLAMLGDKENNNVKSALMRALIDFSTEFSTRSVQAYREEQTANVSQILDASMCSESSFSVSTSAVSMTKRVENMIQWRESNHLIVAFHNSDIQTLSALYRERFLVPKHIKDLFETQVKKKLPDFQSLDQKQLQEILQRIARSAAGDIPKETLLKLGHDYALTPDNLLKMILIILRIKAHVPVIIMGETGCGKTSLIRYLAVICDVKLEVQNIHAGTDESTITKRVMDANEKAKANLHEPVWVFLDEINTCNHLGLINNIVCHHICQDTALAPNLVLMAACNPYKLRNEASVLTAGLTTKIKTDEQSKLVYRVNPLPETMVDFVWDYGSLSDEDEKVYIQRMVDGIVQDRLVKLLVELLVMSQNFTKKTMQNESCVSLRDVSRCKRLIVWFKSTLKTKYPQLTNNQCEIKSVILSLAHSYHSRLAKNTERCQYRKDMLNLFMSHKITGFTSEKDILDAILLEQKDILNRMELPEGTARNIALQENVFVILVCILNHIPIFVIGKPGCSKSLSLQLIKNNLRGKDSHDEYFKTLPQLYCISYQGSESSTSDGLVKVFDKAKRYRKHNKEDDVLPVVVLDEIGLAEVSRFNPLKVLHSLLEPGDKEVPDIAVVGISNWALDAAKMNRAIHLSRPDMDVDELYLTGVSISEASIKAEHKISTSLFSPEKVLQDNFQNIDHNLLKAIAESYKSYIYKQSYQNFHGLRDYYSLVKFVSKELSQLSEIDGYPERKNDIILKGLLRNFGGLPTELSSIVRTFNEHFLSANINFNDSFSENQALNVISLIKENICDPGARHLLLTVCGDSVLSIIESMLQNMNREYELIMGSQFEEDLTDDYNYRILSRIILCMEQGVVLILKDLDSIYGSLYDMLNQNYTTVGKRKNCRIAHGACSNPLCHVHDQFRCIVLVEEGKLDMSDPPFLNRFEKQNVRLSDILTCEEKQLVMEMDSWLEKATKVEDFPFTKVDFIPIFSPDMISSLVHFTMTVSLEGKAVSQKDLSLEFNENSLNKCKDTLLQMCSPDGIIRLQKTFLAKENEWACQKLTDKYFALPLHEGLSYCVKDMIQNNSHVNHKLIVFTHSNLHTDLGSCMKPLSSKYQIEKLSSFKSEKQLSNRIGHFWLDSDDEWLIIQCSHVDMVNFLLMKSIVEKFRNEFENTNSGCKKNVIIVLHLERGLGDMNLGLISFLCGWKLCFVDKLEHSPRPLTSLLDKTMENLLDEQRPLTSFISENLFWAFTCIGYSNGQRTMDSLVKIINKIKSEEILFAFEKLMMGFVQEKQQSVLMKQNWQLDVACSALKLFNACTFQSALEQEIHSCLKPSLAALVYQIEFYNAWDVLTVAAEKHDRLQVWNIFAFDRHVVNIADVPAPAGPQCYLCPLLIDSLQYPFICHFFEKIANLKKLFLEKLRSYKAELKLLYDDDEEDEDDDHLGNIDFDDEDQIAKVKTEMCNRFKGIISVTANELFQNEYTTSQEDYFSDFCRYIGASRKMHISDDNKHQIIMMTMKPLLSSENGFLETVTEIQVTFWLYESYVISSLNLVDACLCVTDISFENIIKECFPPKIAETDVGDYHANSFPDYVSDISDFEEKAELDSDNLSVEKKIAAGESHSSNEYDIGNGDDNGNSVNSCDVEVSVGKENVSENRLVNYCCKQMIPSKHMANIKVDEWHQGVSLVLSLSSEVSLEPKYLQYLRVCSDFASLIVIPLNLPNHYLLELGDTMMGKDLVSNEFLSYLFSLLIDLRTKKQNSEKELQHFLSCYISSCLSADPDSQILFWAFRELKDNMLDETFSFFGPTVHQALFMEVRNGLDILNDDQLKDNEFVHFLNDLLAEFDESQNGSSCFGALISDILIDFFLKSATLFEGDLANDTAVIKEMLKCHNTFLDEDEQNLKFLVAIAFLKNVMSSFSNVLIRNDFIPEHFSSEIQQILSIFHLDETDEFQSTRNEKIKTMQMMLLRFLVKGDGLKGFDVIKQSVTTKIEFLQEIEVDTEQRLLSYEQNPCGLHAEEEKNAFFSVKTKPELMNSLIKSATKNAKLMMRIYSFVIQQLYLVQAFRPITDTERSLSESFINCAKESSMLPMQINLLERLCLRKDFLHPLLQISSLTDSQSFSMVSVLVHLFSIIIANVQEEKTNSKRSLFSSCLLKLNQVDSKHLFAFYDSEGKMNGVVSHIGNCVKFFNCSCGFITASCASEELDKCLVCKTDSTKNEIHFTAGQRYSNLENDFKNHLISVRKLSPLSFQILNFLLYGCVIGSFALEITPPKDLTDLLKLSDSADIVSHLNEHLEIHWEALKTLTSFGNAQLCKFLHFILEDQQELFLNGLSQFWNDKEREEFENTFDQYVVSLATSRFEIIQRKIIFHSKTVNDNFVVKFEKALEDICDDKNSKILARLFRTTVPPSFNHMQAEFLNSKMRLMYPFLGLVFEKKLQLDLLSHLLPCVQWHLCTVKYISHRIKRANSVKTTLATFIYNSMIDEDEDNKKVLKKAYEDFTKSWNRLREYLPILQKYNPDIVQMERINKESSLSETLVMDDTSPMYLVMKALQNMHNEFLEEAVVITLSTRCYSTNFLKRSKTCSVLASVNLEDISEKEMISNPFDEDLLKFSQCNPNPGCGLQREYDFYQIEMQVADKCLINKPYIKIQTNFPQVIFSGEMLRMSKTLFDELRNTVHQKPLDKELEKLVIHLKETNPSNLQGLLNYLEMAFSLLTRNPLQRHDVDQNLTELLQQWQSLISVQIPAVSVFCSKVPLCCIIALYEFVEVLMADVIIDSLEEKYTKPIPEECVDNLVAVKNSASIQLIETFLYALKRFAFRYLSASSIDPSDKLSPYLMDATLWPTGVVQKVSAGSSKADTGILSPLLAVEHTMSTILFFEEALKEKKRKIDKASGRLSLHTENQGKNKKHKAARLFRKK